MLNIKFQRGPFISGNSQLRNLPLKSCCVYHLSRAFAGRVYAYNGKIRIYHFINDNVKGPGLGDIRG